MLCVLSSVLNKCFAWVRGFDVMVAREYPRGSGGVFGVDLVLRAFGRYFP